jgi:hypothetical protein
MNDSQKVLRDLDSTTATAAEFAQAARASLSLRYVRMSSSAESVIGLANAYATLAVYELLNSAHSAQIPQ